MESSNRILEKSPFRPPYTTQEATNWTHIDVTGFQALHSPNTVDADLILDGTEERVKEAYYGEVEQLLKRVTGASDVVFLDHTVRKVRPNQLDDSP